MHDQESRFRLGQQGQAFMKRRKGVQSTATVFSPSASLSATRKNRKPVHLKNLLLFKTT